MKSKGEKRSERRRNRPGEVKWGPPPPESWAMETGAVGSALSVQCYCQGSDGCPAGQKRQYYYEPYIVAMRWHWPNNDY